MLKYLRNKLKEEESKSIEEKIKEVQIPKDIKRKFIITIILLIAINIYQMYDSRLSDDAIYMNSLLENSMNNIVAGNVLDTENVLPDNIDILSKSVYKSPFVSKISLSYAIFANQVTVAMANIVQGNEFEYILVPEYNGDNKYIKQLLTDMNEFNKILEQCQYFAEIENKDELTKVENQVFKDIPNRVLQIEKSTIYMIEFPLFVNHMVNIFEVWNYLGCFLIVSLYGISFLLKKYYEKELTSII